jgi:hypothetical protein
MYAKTRPTAGSLSPKQKRVFAIVGVLVILLLVGLGVGGALAHDSLGTSANGCVNVTVPSSTGGSTLHYCGSQRPGPLAQRARPQCTLAGLKPSTAASP